MPDALGADVTVQDPLPVGVAERLADRRSLHGTACLADRPPE